MTGLGEIGENGHFGGEMAIFEPKKAQNEGKNIFFKTFTW